MLTVFRNVLPGPLRAADMERCDNADIGAGVVGGGPIALAGARSPLLGVLIDLAGVDGCCRPDDIRVLATGNTGRPIPGGPSEDREGFGSVVVMLRSWKRYQAVALWIMNHSTRVLVNSESWMIGSVVLFVSLRKEWMRLISKCTGKKPRRIRNRSRKITPYARVPNRRLWSILKDDQNCFHEPASKNCDGGEQDE